MREKTFYGRVRDLGVWLIATIVFGSILLLTQPLFAFPANVEVFGKVSLGEQPKLVLTVTEPAQNAQVSFTREDGRKYSYALGNVNEGFVKEIALDGQTGKHRYEGMMQAQVEGELLESPLSFSTVVAPPLSINVDRGTVDLKARTFSFRTSRAVQTLNLKLISIDGRELASENTQIKNWKQGEAIVVSWPPVSQADLLRFELRVEDEDGFFNAVALTPWSVEIPHEEVLFASGSAALADSEVPKLEASLAEITTALKRFSQIQGVQLFIAGHTDTVGSVTFNQNLSRKRAQAIAAWFVTRRVGLRVSYEGFGEMNPQVKTADETDEARNRRVDYILSVEAPNLKSGVHAWKRLN